jgi:Zn-dependent peptidase ImmA (M78 family)
MSFVKFINKENLKTARENMGLDTFGASKKITTSGKDIVADWENGDSLPTWSQVSKLSKLYNVAELLFFATENIQKNKNIPDYRVGIKPENDEKVKKLINLVALRQKWLEKFLKEEGFPKNQLQGTGKNLNSPKKLAEFITEKLGIKLGEIKNISGRKNALNYLIHKAEAKNIFVGKTISYHQLEVDDMRGLFMSNDYCPFIILNRRDALAAQIFSFVHELAHFFRRSDAVSNSLDFRTTKQEINPEEIFCNKVAAELLLPESEFVKDFYEKSDIDNVSEIFKVSKIFIFYRLKELGKIRKDIQNQLEKEIQIETARNIKAKSEAEAKSKGGNYTNSMKDSNGGLFNRVISRSYSDNKIGYVEASNLLKFSPEKV